jgi:hypothetical protein
MIIHRTTTLTTQTLTGFLALIGTSVFLSLFTVNAWGVTADDVVCPRCVDTSDLAARAVTAGKLAADAVRTGKIENRAVTRAKLAPDSVGTGKIVDGAVTQAKLSAGLAAMIDDLKAQVATLEAKLAAVSVNADGDLVISGANLFIQSGNGATDAAVNGKGNLIIGYNEDPLGLLVRTGSHNVIVGPAHSYTSFGGFVAGLGNTISGEHASVTGGDGNAALSDHSAILGGSGNTTANVSPPKETPVGLAATISGGSDNIATGDFASVSGGSNNTASANGTSVSGGKGNIASNDLASISGGRSNTASGQDASVSGGGNNTASGDGASISGGHGCTEARDQGWSVGDTDILTTGCTTSN